MNSNKRLRDSMENFLTAGSYGVSQAQQQKNLLQPPKKSNAGRKKKTNTETLLDEGIFDDYFSGKHLLYM